MNVCHVHIILEKKERRRVVLPSLAGAEGHRGMICTGMETAKSMHFWLTWQWLLMQL
jgi:hypothetical protein